MNRIKFKILTAPTVAQGCHNTGKTESGTTQKITVISSRT